MRKVVAFSSDDRPSSDCLHQRTNEHTTAKQCIAKYGKCQCMRNIFQSRERVRYARREQNQAQHSLFDDSSEPREGRGGSHLRKHKPKRSPPRLAPLAGAGRLPPSFPLLAEGSLEEYTDWPFLASLNQSGYIFSASNRSGTHCRTPSRCIPPSFSSCSRLVYCAMQRLRCCPLRRPLLIPRRT